MKHGHTISPSLDENHPKNPLQILLLHSLVHIEHALSSALFQVLALDRMRGRKMVALMMTVVLLVKPMVELRLTAVLSLLAKVYEL